MRPVKPDDSSPALQEEIPIWSRKTTFLVDEKEDPSLFDEDEFAPELTVIVPTRNESGNVQALVDSLESALDDVMAEIIFVDDSSDETPARVLEVAESSTKPVRLIHRELGERAGGLGGAVLRGMRVARAPWVVVMDGDLQHPADVVPQLLGKGRATGADIVVASRYCGDGDSTGLGNAARVAVSASATRAARWMFPRRLAKTSDPMSGFFAVRLGAIDLERMRPMGFKILLELMVRSPQARVAEVPFRFEARYSGDSKTSAVEGLRFLLLMLRLRCSVLLLSAQPSVPSLFSRIGRMIGFGAVGSTGIAVNLGLLWVLAGQGAVHYLLAAAIATQGSTTWNFIWTDTLVFRGRKPRTRFSRYLCFSALNNSVLLLRLPLLALLVSGLGVNYLAANALTLLLAFLSRFIVSDRFIYANGEDMTDLASARPAVVTGANGAPAPSVRPVQPQKVPVRIVAGAPGGATVIKGNGRRNMTDYLQHRYDVPGLASLRSEIPLPELEYFRAPQLGRRVDIEIRVGGVGNSRMRARTVLTQYDSPRSIAYQEHFGRLGANFQVDLGDPIKVIVSPLLAKSPHVVYTNIIEALLRFIAVDRGRMLLHSACLQLGGRGVILSARTDTGKTGTILRLLREQDARFLSDDMTIISPDGQAYCFPKPLTISQHTLRAVGANVLNAREWRRLRLQSRLHSKEGRQFGQKLASYNFPIMGVNALTQIAVPPPKFFVDRLVPCDTVPEVALEDLFIIERGAPKLSEMTTTEALTELIENTDDAYEFPPFRYFAPALVIGDADYELLRVRESGILAGALRGLRTRRLASDNFSWADSIPEILGVDATARRGEAPVPLTAVGPIDIDEADAPVPVLDVEVDLTSGGHSNGFAHTNGNGHKAATTRLP